MLSVPENQVRRIFDWSGGVCIPSFLSYRHLAYTLYTITIHAAPPPTSLFFLIRTGTHLYTICW